MMDNNVTFSHFLQFWTECRVHSRGNLKFGNLKNDAESGVFLFFPDPVNEQHWSGKTVIKVS